ncbi:1-deoxy-D-xylulose-5-phosphate reductoisomerase [Psychrobacillus sp. FJAT-51614]|uniref:1-deoxy-D-xylulose 5-phosphate reductoisomerase n=1 Tax=Psychrobacillus mangrovi TaxID=3117745 RepID=A0ABU8F0N1_9BACI
MTKRISLLGATGSIGIQTLDIIKEHPSKFQLVSFSAGKNIEKTREILKQFSVEVVSVSREEDARMLQTEFPKVHVFYGDEGLVQVAANTNADVLVNAVLGSIGLKPTLEAINKGITIAIANKETLVTAGHLVMQAAMDKNVPILPVDSEHSALFQAMNGEQRSEISKLIITASGGSFRDQSRDELKNVTVKDALNHPNWSMGAKITIDSATMMNKGLEVIEAHVLFDISYDDIEVLLHRESIIHSMVEFKDTSIIAQLGTPDMRVPIQYALSYPNRLERANAKRLNLAEIGKLHFEEMNYTRYHALKLAIDAGRAGGSMTTVLNAANEAAVDLFLQEKVSFLEIDELIERAMNEHVNISSPDLETILQVDTQTRKTIQNMIK